MGNFLSKSNDDLEISDLFSGLQAEAPGNEAVDNDSSSATTAVEQASGTGSNNRSSSINQQEASINLTSDNDFGNFFLLETDDLEEEEEEEEEIASGYFPQGSSIEQQALQLAVETEHFDMLKMMKDGQEQSTIDFAVDLWNDLNHLYQVKLDKLGGVHGVDVQDVPEVEMKRVLIAKALLYRWVDGLLLGQAYNYYGINYGLERKDL